MLPKHSSAMLISAMPPLLCPLNQVYHTIPSGFWQAGGVPLCRQVPHAQWYRRAFSGYLDFSQDIPRL